MTVSDSLFQPSLARSVFIDDPLDDALLARLTPQILALREQSSEPIAFYINSPGGFPEVETCLRGLLASPNSPYQDIRLITVVTCHADSAAADLLIAGKYAIAYPGAKIFCHGSRMPKASEITKEISQGFFSDLAAANEEAARQIAFCCFDRFLFRYIVYKDRILAIRESSAEDAGELSDLACLLEFLCNQVSENAELVRKLRRAFEVCVDQERLEVHISEQLWDGDKKDKLEIDTTDRDLLKIILDFQPEALFFSGLPISELGLATFAGEMMQAYLERNDIALQEHFFEQAVRWRRWLLNAEDKEKWRAFNESEKQEWLAGSVDALIAPFWFFLHAIARELQIGENALSAEEAYWLGLIDEIHGQTDRFPSMRVWLEAKSLLEDEDMDAME